MIFTTYYDEIIRLAKNDEAREHSYRTPLENLFKTNYPSYNILHEGSSNPLIGRPDFTISNKDNHTIGFIECKDFGFDLKSAITNKKSYENEYNQLIKYLTIGSLVIFTNYIDFILIKQSETGIEILEECSFNGKNSGDLEKVFNKFLQSKPLSVNTKDAFIKSLALKTKYLRDDILLDLADDNSYFTKSQVHTLFSETIYQELDEKDFADSFAQIITFGLLFYRLTLKQNVAIETFKEMPKFIPFLRELLDKVDFREATGIRYILDSIIATVNNYDEEIFFNGTHYKDSHDKKEEDPFIYMYENFLKEFDKKTRNARGVFYTPIEVVNYIIKSIDEVLKNRLDIKEGFANKEVYTLDFATGTGTFLLGAIEHIYKDLEKKDNLGFWKGQVKDVILKNLYGFEYLVVPYVLAHFRIHQYLEDCDYTYEKDDRLKLYLTNTLDDIKPTNIPFFPYLTEEVSQAHKIKNSEPILVIMGNPPYNKNSDAMNSRPGITGLVEAYKKEEFDGKEISNLTGTEKGILSYDEIKFIRFAHHKMEQVDKGVMAMIVNNSFINSPSHRIMRKKLMETFDEIYIYDLHGNMIKKEKCPDGSQDTNVFEIASVGVCIAIFIKTCKKNNKNKGVYHQEIYGKREDKKEALINSYSWQTDWQNKVWQKIEDDDKYHWFTPIKSNDKYKSDFIGLREIFKKVNSGVTSGKDKLIINFSPAELDNSLKDILNLTEEEICDKYKIEYTDHRLLELKQAKTEVKENKGIKTTTHYKPFDSRYIYYTKTNDGFITRARYNTMQHLISNNDNIGLVFAKGTTNYIGFEHVLVTTKFIDINLMGRLSNIALLYLYDDFGTPTANFTQDFLVFIRTYHTQEPEIILAYIYAVLYAPAYRTKYKADLIYDYPRIPFTNDKVIFNKVAKLGQKLINLHTFKTDPVKKPSYPVSGNHKVARCELADSKLFINDSQYFNGVSKSVFSYTIGGYKVLEKYIKVRNDRELTVDEINHICNIVGILQDTIEIVKDIDKIEGVW